MGSAVVLGPNSGALNIDLLSTDNRLLIAWEGVAACDATLRLQGDAPPDTGCGCDTGSPRERRPRPGETSVEYPMFELNGWGNIIFLFDSSLDSLGEAFEGTLSVNTQDGAVHEFHVKMTRKSAGFINHVTTHDVGGCRSC